MHDSVVVSIIINIIIINDLGVSVIVLVFVLVLKST